MTAKICLTNEGNFSAEQVKQLVPELLPYSWKLISLVPVSGELHDYIMTVNITAD